MGAPSSPAPAPPLADASPPAAAETSPPDEQTRLLRLRCGVQHYEWGRLGHASLVARLAAADPDSGVAIDPEFPYAELWMGTHPSMPSTVLPGGEPLSGWLARNKQDALGPAAAEDLPFLFKVLSVAKPLSIQAHPDKRLAEALHDQRPDAYRDANHKPEMAIALTDFRALFGFAGIQWKSLTHPSMPSVVLPGGEPLSGWLARNEGALGPAVTDLPFLFKVLSVAKPLSIQAHPDKALAEALHDQRPDAYRDANHKPEMAIALTDFRALFGFAGIQELKDVIRTVPEIQGLIGHEDADKLMTIKEQHGGSDVKSSLKTAFAKLMAASKEAVSEAVTRLKGRLNDDSKIRTLTEKELLILSLERQYPEDVGVLAALLFNYVKLSPGEAIYIGANEPHAYLSGDCIECMASSDNVVRAGLTPKYRDVDTLCSMLTYKQVFPEILRGVPVQPYVRRYTPQTDEFEVDCCSLPPGQVVVMPPSPSPSIYLVMTGEGEIQVDNSMLDGEKAKEGDVFFVPAYTAVKLSACGHASMQLYRAGVNSTSLSSCNTVVPGKKVPAAKYVG